MPAALAEKAFAAERRLVWLRLAVVTCNVILYFAFLAPRLAGTRPTLAVVVTVLAFSYSLYVLFAEPYRRFPILMTGYFVSSADAVASILWIHATGGFRSPFFLLLYLLAVGAAFRHRTGDAILVSVLCAGSYAGLLAIRGELLPNLVEVAPRILYTFLAAGMGLLFAREVVEQTVARLELAARARAEDARLRLAAIVDSSGDAIIGLTPNGTVESWNARASQTFGWAFSEVEGKPALTLLGPQHWSATNEALDRVRRGEVVDQLETVGVRKDGRAFTLALVASPIRDAGGAVSGIALIGRDMTERKQLEARLVASERMASVGTLAGSVAREINEPLAEVIASVDAVIGRVRDLGGPQERIDELSSVLGEARQGADRVSRVVRDFQVFARPAESATVPVDVRRVLESTLNIARTEIDRRARLVKEYAEVPPVHASESGLGQVLLNLILNVAESIPEGQADRNEIRIATQLRGSDRVAIEVADTGAGIADEPRRSIFDPPPAPDGAASAAPMRLSVCQGIVTLFGGELEVENEARRGSVVRVLLRAARS